MTKSYIVEVENLETKKTTFHGRKGYGPFLTALRSAYSAKAPATSVANGINRTYSMSRKKLATVLEVELEIKNIIRHEKGLPYGVP
jgi:hypothetical protein